LADYFFGILKPMEKLFIVLSKDVKAEVSEILKQYSAYFDILASFTLVTVRFTPANPSLSPTINPTPSPTNNPAASLFSSFSVLASVPKGPLGARLQVFSALVVGRDAEQRHLESVLKSHCGKKIYPSHGSVKSVLSAKFGDKANASSSLSTVLVMQGNNGVGKSTVARKVLLTVQDCFKHVNFFDLQASSRYGVFGFFFEFRKFLNIIIVL
jgi:hypothetical protein